MVRLLRAMMLMPRMMIIKRSCSMRRIHHPTHAKRRAGKGEGKQEDGKDACEHESGFAVRKDWSTERLGIEPGNIKALFLIKASKAGEYASRINRGDFDRANYGRGR